MSVFQQGRLIVSPNYYPYLDAVECRYNAVQYNMMLFTALQRLGQKSIRVWTHKQLTGEIWGENGLRYNSTTLYIQRLETVT